MKLPSFLLWVGSGVLFGVSFISPFLFWCFIPGFVLLLRLIANESSYIRLFWIGIIVGALQYAGSFFWIWSIYPINWMPDQSIVVQFLAIGAYWVLTSAVMGIGCGLFVLTTKFVSRSHWQLIVFVPLLWLISEIIKSICFSLYSFGPGSFLSAGFSFGYLGYLLAPYGALLQLSTFAGVYGLSVVAALMGVVLYVCVDQKTLRHPLVIATVCVAFVVPLLIPSSFFQHENESSQRVIAVETYFDKNFLTRADWKEVKNRELKIAVERALKEEADAIVLPEDAELHGAFKDTEELFLWIDQHAPSRDIVLIDNGIALDSRNQSVMRTYIYDTKTRSVYFFDKQYLVPQGEFLSYIHEGILSLFATDDRLASIKQYARLQPGVIHDSEALPSYLPGVLFCFETAVPYAVQKIKALRNPSFIVHPISYGWFTDPYSLEYQLDAMLKVQAVWSKTPIVSAGSMTQSNAYQPDGTVHEGTEVAKSTYWSVKLFEF